MFDMNSTKSEVVSGTVGVFPNIVSLAAEHDRITCEFNDLYETTHHDKELRPLNNRCWVLRALIAATPAQSQADLHAMARILKDEAARDTDFECDCAGSARDLTRAFAEAVMALPVE